MIKVAAKWHCECQMSALRLGGLGFNPRSGHTKGCENAIPNASRLGTQHQRLDWGIKSRDILCHACIHTRVAHGLPAGHTAREPLQILPRLITVIKVAATSNVTRSSALPSTGLRQVW